VQNYNYFLKKSMFSASFHVKMNKIASFYVIFALRGIEIKDFCVILQRVLERDTYLLLNFLSRITTSE